MRTHNMAKCPNCRGLRMERSSQCPKKKEVRQAAKGRGLQTPPSRHREGAAEPSPRANLPPEAATADEEMEADELNLPQDEVRRMEE